MKKVQIVLDRPVTAATATRGDDPTIQERHARDLALQTLEQIEMRLQAIQTETRSQIQQVGTHVIDLAINVAKSLFANDSELLNRRLDRFIELGIECSAPAQISTIAVHPECCEAIEKWKQDDSLRDLKIVGDPMIQPGDCRVETDEQGLLMELDSFLQAAHDELLQPLSPNGPQD